jgi:hypothetical protein
MKPSATKGRILYPKCAKTHLRASVISKIFPGVTPPDPRYKGEGKGREGKGGREGAGKGGEGKGGEGRGGKGGGREGEGRGGEGKERGEMSSVQ